MLTDEELKLIMKYMQRAIDIGKRGTDVDVTAAGLTLELYLEMQEVI